jgi:hypothetical protein
MKDPKPADSGGSASIEIGDLSQGTKGVITVNNVGSIQTAPARRSRQDAAEPRVMTQRLCGPTGG